MITTMQKFKPTVLAPWTRHAQIAMEKIAPISMPTPMLKITPDGDCQHQHQHQHIIISKSISISSSHHIFITSSPSSYEPDAEMACWSISYSSSTTTSRSCQCIFIYHISSLECFQISLQPTFTFSTLSHLLLISSHSTFTFSLSGTILSLPLLFPPFSHSRLTIAVADLVMCPFFPVCS